MTFIDGRARGEGLGVKWWDSEASEEALWL
jgi:hypothetical protein